VILWSPSDLSSQSIELLKAGASFFGPTIAAILVAAVGAHVFVRQRAHERQVKWYEDMIHALAEATNAALEGTDIKLADATVEELERSRDSVQASRDASEVVLKLNQIAVLYATPKSYAATIRMDTAISRGLLRDATDEATVRAWMQSQSDAYTAALTALATDFRELQRLPRIRLAHYKHELLPEAEDNPSK
jgi:hypothetical protein